MAAPTETWRRLPLAVMTAGEALGRAEALLASAAERGPAFAWTMVDPPALIVGRAAGRAPVDMEACRRAGVRVYRRDSGGGPVLWDGGLLSLDVALPPGHRLAPTDVVAAYAPVGEALAAALRDLGAASARTVPLEEARAWRPAEGTPEALAATACFGGLSPHEVVDGAGRKVVGLAQVRRRAGTLIQAGVLLRFDAAGLARLLDVPAAARPRLAPALEARAVGLDRLGVAAGPARVVEAAERALRSSLRAELIRDDEVYRNARAPLG